MMQSQTTLKLNVNISREALLAKLPVGIKLEQKKEVKKAEEVKPKIEKIVTKFINEVLPPPKAKEKPEPKTTAVKVETTDVKQHFENKIIGYGLYVRILKHFQAKYPNCFSKPVRPLKIGIYKEVLGECKELGVSHEEMARFFKAYCKNAKYKLLIAQGVGRVDLQGILVEPVKRASKLSETARF